MTEGAHIPQDHVPDYPGVFRFADLFRESKIVPFVEGLKASRAFIRTESGAALSLDHDVQTALSGFAQDVREAASIAYANGGNDERSSFLNYVGRYMGDRLQSGDQVVALRTAIADLLSDLITSE